MRNVSKDIPSVEKFTDSLQLYPFCINSLQNDRQFTYFLMISASFLNHSVAFSLESRCNIKEQSLKGKKRMTYFYSLCFRSPTTPHQKGPECRGEAPTDSFHI